MTLAIWIIAIVLVLANLELVIGGALILAAIGLCLAVLGALLALAIHYPEQALAIGVFVVAIFGFAMASHDKEMKP